ncbi:Respiratory-chain NADH dehydrogenase, 30 Kd subunit (modular protein) [uncultured delta proteobacterium]|uniref:Respiratory-chain NADH dehydrogenase, 30 Kd subunit (Modular protein) n=1 Tax=uncultured delta proteobacterium TaxID=34034 RepID=A0A212JY41_9DELT|nr:Respiratory-chain NADH dehydrogenase, 30 Kd subunit (modular protein) [uncultured delta proteobacterium]
MMPAPLQNFDCLFLSKENQAKVGYAALAVVAPEKLLDLAKAFLAGGYHLEDVSGLITSDGAVSMYHFAHFDKPGRASVMAVAPADKPSFPSIASVYQGAEWHERETRDFFGFQYEGNPNFIPLLLADNMVDVHPLLKEDAARAPLHAIFSSEGREREIVKKADGFTLLDVPVKEEAPAEAPAPAEAAPAPKPEAPKAETPKEEPKPEASAGTPGAEAAPAAPAEAPKEAPAAVKAEPEVKPEPAPASKPEPKAEAKPEPKAEKVTASVKKGKVVQGNTDKKGAGK